MDDLDALADRFARFAARECAKSPLYEALARGTSGDHELLELAAQGRSGPKPNLFLAAVHYLLLAGADHSLAAYYASRTAVPLPPEGAWCHFARFCRQHADQISALLATRRVQTNEVARAAYLLPAWGLVAGHAPDRPLALVEVGTSAGLLLFWDRYAYDYDTGAIHGDADSPARLHCALHGPGRPPFPARLPTVVARVGIDMNPIDLRDPDARLWLRALVWPDQPQRADRLERAAALVAAESPTLMAGDALDLLPAALAGLPADALVVVFHSHALNQFAPADRERFLGLVAQQSQRRDIWLVSLEGPNAMPMPSRTPSPDFDAEMWVTRFTAGQVAEQRLWARYDAHGEWLRWAAT